MEVRWEIKGEDDRWTARVENRIASAFAEGSDVFEVMMRAEEELARKTERILRAVREVKKEEYG